MRDTTPTSPTDGRSYSIPTAVLVIFISILVLYSIVSTGLWMLILENNDLGAIFTAIAGNIF